MLSPDPYVQASDYAQNFNRYSYVLNNPLKYVDPDGELVWIVPAIVEAVFGGVSGAIMADQAGAQGFWEWAGYIGGGALIGGVSGYAGWALSTVGVAAPCVGMASGMISGGGMSALSGGDIIQGMTLGGISSMFGGMASMGTTSILGNYVGVSGGRFANAMAEIGYYSLSGGL